MTSPRPVWSSVDEAAWRSWWRSVPKDELLASLPRPKVGEVLSDKGAVFLALTEGLRGVGHVSPNPLVGCVIRNADGCYLGSGGHLIFGGPHAEINAMAMVSGNDLKGSDVTVTLEPCAHHGKTPPCVDTLVKAQVGQVRYLVKDPNPEVDGRGASCLHQSGIRVKEDALFEDLGEELSEVFLYNFRNQDIFVGLKAATTQDGIYAGDKTSRQWITGERSRQYGHFLRLSYDAIAIGASTALLDNPQLNVRSLFVSGRTPYRVVLDPEGRLLQSWRDLHLLNGSSGNSLWVMRDGVSYPDEFQGDRLSLELNAQGKFDWTMIKKYLWGKGYRSLLLEGGAGLWDSALSQNIVQKMHWFVGSKEPGYNEAHRKWGVPSKPSGMSWNQYSLNSDQYYEWSLGS